MGASVTILAPFAGRVVALADLPDPVFAQEIMGAGIALDPEEVASVIALAPCAGSVAKLFPGGHGIAIESVAGPILLHIGLETVALKGVGLTALVSDGDQLVAGQPLVELAAAKIRAGGTSLLTPIVAIGGQRVEQLAVPGAQVPVGEPLFVVHPA
ncbi:MAG: PTS sugar transporter subunit IIA [Candidatus Limnocylindrus sp.]